MGIAALDGFGGDVTVWSQPHTRHGDGVRAHNGHNRRIDARLDAANRSLSRVDKGKISGFIM